MLFQALVVAAVACQALANPIDDPTRTLSAKRCETSYVYTLIGDGDPHQNYYNEQVSVRLVPIMPIKVSERNMRTDGFP